MGVIRALTDKLEISGYRVDTYDSLDAFEQRAKQLESFQQLRAVVSAGGDGTATAVASRIASTVPLWLCPLGTENLLARYLGMTADPDQAVASISRLQTRSLDAGLANGRLFLIMVGIGFDAEVVRQVHTRRKGHIRRYQYWLPIARNSIFYSFPRLRIVAESAIHNVKESKGLSAVALNAADGRAIDSQEAAWVFLLNLPRYAAGLDIAPDACGEDGLIDICAFKQGGLLRGLYYFARLRLGIHSSMSDFSHQRASKFRVEAVLPDESQISYQLDGDWGGYLPLDIESLPGRLLVVEPMSQKTSSARTL